MNEIARCFPHGAREDLNRRQQAMPPPVASDATSVDL